MVNQNPNDFQDRGSGLISRRQFLQRAGLAAGGALAGSLLLAGACKKNVTTLTTILTTTTTPPPTTAVRLPPVNGLEYLVNSDPSIIDNSQLPVTPPSLLHVLNPSPLVDIDGYKLSVHGFVSNTLSLSYPDLHQFSMKEETALLICPTAFADNELLGGFALTDLLTRAGVHSDATQLVLTSLDHITETIALTDALSQDMFLALTLEGQPLTQPHGYPLRLIRPGKIGVFWLKCLSDIQVT